MCDKSLNNKFLKFFESRLRLGCCERVERCVFRRRKAEDGYGTAVLSQVCVTKITASKLPLLVPLHFLHAHWEDLVQHAV